MKKLFLLILSVVVLNSCEWFATQDTAYIGGLSGVYELKEVLGKDGNPVTEYPESDFPPFIYEQCLTVKPELQLREIDTLYYLSDGEGTVLKKFAIVSKPHIESLDEALWELENQKFVWGETLHDLSLLLSQQADTKNSAKNTAYRGRYTYYTSRPKNWNPLP